MDLINDIANEATKRIIYCDRDRDLEFVTLAENIVREMTDSNDWTIYHSAFGKNSEPLAAFIECTQSKEDQPAYEHMRMAKLVLYSPNLPAFIYVLKLDCALFLYRCLAAVGAHQHMLMPSSFYRIGVACTSAPDFHEHNLIEGSAMAVRSKWSAVLYDQPRLTRAYGDCLLREAARNGLRAITDGSESSDGGDHMDDSEDLGLDASSDMSMAESSEHWSSPAPVDMPRVRALLAKKAARTSRPRAYNQRWTYFGNNTTLQSLYEPMQRQHAPTVRTLLIVYFYTVYQCSELLIIAPITTNRDELLLRLSRRRIDWLVADSERPERRRHLPQRPCDISLQLVFSVYEAAVRIGMAISQGKIWGDTANAAIISLLHPSFPFISKGRLTSALWKLCNVFAALRSTCSADSVSEAQRMVHRATDGDPVAEALTADLFDSHMLIREMQAVRPGHRILSHRTFCATTCSSGAQKALDLTVEWRCFLQQRLLAYLQHTYTDEQLVTLCFTEDPVPTPLELRATVTSSLPALRDGRDYMIVWSPLHVHRQIFLVMQRKHMHVMCGGEMVRCLARQQRFENYWFPRRTVLYAGVRIARAFMHNACTGYHLQALAIICRVRVAPITLFREGDEVDAACARLQALLERVAPTRTGLVDAICNACEKGDGAPLWTLLETALTPRATEVLYTVPNNKPSIPIVPPASASERGKVLWESLFGGINQNNGRVVERKRPREVDEDYDCDDECPDPEERRWQEEDRRRAAEVRELMRLETSGKRGAINRAVRRRRGVLFTGKLLRTRTDRHVALSRGELHIDEGRSHLLLLDALLVAKPRLPLAIFARIRVNVNPTACTSQEVHSVPLISISPAGNKDKWQSSELPELSKPAEPIAKNVSLCAVLACAMDCVPGLYRKSGGLKKEAKGDADQLASRLAEVRKRAHEIVDHLLDDTRRQSVVYTPIARSPIIGTIPESYSATRYNSIERIALVTDAPRSSQSSIGGVPRPFTDAYPCCIEAVFTNFYWTATQNNDTL